MTLAYEQWKWRRRLVTCLLSSWNMTNVLCGWTGRIQEDLGQAFVIWAKKQETLGQKWTNERKGNPEQCLLTRREGRYIMYLCGNKKEKDPGLANIDPGPVGWKYHPDNPFNEHGLLLCKESGPADGHSKIRTLWRYKQTCKLIPVQQFTLKITKYWWMQLDPGIWETKFLQANEKCQCSQSGRTRTKISVQKEKNNQMCNF